MRHGAATLLAIATLALGAADAAAYRVDFRTNGNRFGQSLGELVAVDVVLDTEGAGDILLLGVGVLFDESVLRYRQDLSSTTTYLLYTNSKSPYLQPASTCGGGYGSPNAGSGCSIFPTRSNQVALDFVSSGLLTGTGVPGTGVGTLVRLVFELKALGSSTVYFDFDPTYGSAFRLGDGSNPPLTLGFGVTPTLVPEPSTGLLVALGLAGIGASVRRHHERSRRR